MPAPELAATPAAPPAIDPAKAWLRRAARQLRAPLTRVALLSSAQTLVLVAQAWLLAGILAAAVFAHAPLARLWPQIMVLVLLAPVRFVLGVAARGTAHGAAQRLADALRARMLRSAQALGSYRLQEHSSGDLITQLVDGIDAVLAYFARYLPQALGAVVIPAVLLLFVFRADWLSGLILLLTAPLIPLFMTFVGHAAEQASERRYTQLRRLGAAFIEALSGLVTLRLLGAAERFAQRLDEDGEAYRALTMQVLRVAFLSALVLEFFAMVSIAMVAVLIGFRLLWGELPLRAGLFVLLLAPELYLPLRALGALRHTRMDAVAAARRLALLDTLGAQERPRPGAMPVRLERAPEVVIDRVCYMHTGGRAALRECSAVLRAGRITALVGATGAGKSTLLSLLLGFAVPDSGTIRVEGVDLTRLDLERWREQVAWVPQRPHIFEGTVRENVRMAAPQADAAALERAAEDSGLAAVLTRLPRGWDTPLGERGLGLSGGELQRLALARALLRERARVWLLDEPTAHLDAFSTRAVESLIRAVAATRTVVLVAHRLSAARSADWVAVMSDGRVIEQGVPSALADTAGAYADLLQAEQS